MNNIETLTLKQICSYVAIVNKMEQEGIIKVDIDKSYVEFDYDETLKYLEKQNVKLNNIINKLEKYLEREDVEIFEGMYEVDNKTLFNNLIEGE